MLGNRAELRNSESPSLEDLNDTVSLGGSFADEPSVAEVDEAFGISGLPTDEEWLELERQREHEEVERELAELELDELRGESRIGPACRGAVRLGRARRGEVCRGEVWLGRGEFELETAHLTPAQVVTGMDRLIDDLRHMHIESRPILPREAS